MIHLERIRGLGQVVDLAKQHGDSEVWGKIIADMPRINTQLNHPLLQYTADFKEVPNVNGKLRSRDLFTYALVLCEKLALIEASLEKAAKYGQHQKERKLKSEEWKNLFKLDVIFDLMRKMQVRGGNFKWFWNDKRAKDPNAVNFCMRGAALLCLLHQHRLKTQCPKGWQTLRRMINRAINGACQRPIPEKFTNIALMNAMNLILLGEAFDWPKIASEGYNRFDRVCLYTWEWGIHEYLSPTYTGIQGNSIALIQRYSANPRIKKQATALLKFLLHYGIRNLASDSGFVGTRSRRLWDYVGIGDARIAETLWVLGVPINPQPHLRLIYPALAACYKTGYSKTRQKEVLKDAIAERLSWGPEIITRESWGPTLNEFRTSYQLPEVTLSTASLGYDYPRYQDLPLTAELIGEGREGLEYQEDPDNARCYFVPDTEHDPYGKNDNHHSPALWAAAQDKNEALGLVLYEPKPRKSLESHFVIPLQPGTQLWVGGKKVTEQISIARQDNREWSRDISLNEPVCVSKDNAKVCVQVIWATNLKGQNAGVRLVWDRESLRKRGDEILDVVRLTVTHHVLDDSKEQKQAPWTQPGAAFLVCVASNSSKNSELKQDDRKKTDPEYRLVDRRGTKRKIVGDLTIDPLNTALKIAVKSLGGRRFATDIKPGPCRNLMDIKTERLNYETVKIEDLPTLRQPEEPNLLDQFDQLQDLVRGRYFQESVEYMESELKGLEKDLEDEKREDLQNVINDTRKIISNEIESLYELEDEDPDSVFDGKDERLKFKALLKIIEKIETALWAFYQHQGTISDIQKRMGEFKKKLENDPKEISDKLVAFEESLKSVLPENLEAHQKKFGNLLQQVKEMDKVGRVKTGLEGKIKTAKEQLLDDKLAALDERKKIDMLDLIANQIRKTETGGLKRVLEIIKKRVDDILPNKLTAEIKDIAKAIDDLSKNGGQEILNSIGAFRDSVKKQQLRNWQERYILRISEWLESDVRNWRIRKVHLIQTLRLHLHYSEEMKSILEKKTSSPGDEDDGTNHLKAIKTIEDYEHRLENAPLIELVESAENHWQQRWEATEGALTPPMRIGSGKGKGARRFVWNPKRGTDIGNVAWTLKTPPVADNTKYYIWARILAPADRTNSLFVRIRERCSKERKSQYSKIWYVGAHKRWTWIPMDLSELGKTAGATALSLEPNKEYTIQIFGRKAGIKLEQLLITTQNDANPNITPIQSFKRPRRRLRTRRK